MLQIIEIFETRKIGGEHYGRAILSVVQYLTEDGDIVQGEKLLQRLNTYLEKLPVNGEVRLQKRYYMQPR